MSPITSWEGAEAVFTFGPDSFGVWLFLALMTAIMVGVVARMVVHENRTFSNIEPDLLKEGAMKGVNI
ncbi:hypothetical protein [Billgrantia endophytica]|uniref:Uncharacterized protein n=1 Tax=Billgrantia endophytica TaxID=2033802 RepID=A0A2N7TXS9_9GAMM|nr:hypothetical protein [Halomonas endophytica]PMR72987.1 hypothetical protein C1H69_19135 [Halomonas endophytica]